MRIKRSIPIAVVATALLAVALPATAPSAAGGERVAAKAAAHKRVCVGNDAGAYVCWQAYGDHFSIKDTTHNGMSAAVVWKTSYGREGVCRNIHGKGTYVDCNYNMRESGRIRFWAVDVDKPTNTYKNWSVDRRANI
jgi:hypothetical protein